MPLPDLQESETLGRSVFSSQKAKRARNGTVVPHVFLERVEADSISVDRMDHAESSVLATLSEKIAHGRTPPQNFYGWATIEIRQAASNGRSVSATPLDDNIYHADIFLNLPHGDERRDIQRQHANELAALSKWLDAP